MDFYFSRFEHRRPPEPLSTPRWVRMIWQVLAVAALVLGANYIYWRWTASLNTDALWYAIPLVLAETLAWIGTVLFTINLWQEKDPPPGVPPTEINDCLRADEAVESRPIKVDLFIATYSEDVELVRLSIRDAMQMTYPGPLDYKVHVLDDGRRPEMKAVCEQEGANYITRQSNIGYKAGNLRNGLEHTDGDFLIICDADTRVFPTLLSHTLGYFRDPDVAWVQTPQWFFDLPEGEDLASWLRRKAGGAGYGVGWLAQKIVGPVTIGRDPFFNDPRMFYDVILRRRNWANAAFCCGAASVHRREAVMQAALRSYVWSVDAEIARHTRDIRDPATREALQDAMRPHVAFDTELTPYKFHVSEDIYTSILLHGDAARRWRSVMHPRIESKMLSPQDMLTWMIQRFKYAAGSLDILFHDNIFN